MNIDDLKAAIERRGYEVRQLDLQPIAGYTTVYILRGEMFMSCSISHEDIDAVLIGVGALAEYWLRHFAKGQRHVCCSQCKEPLLQKKTQEEFRGAILRPGQPLERLNYPYEAYEYRSAKAGPDSEVLTVCCGCGIELDAQSAVEITD